MASRKRHLPPRCYSRSCGQLCGYGGGCFIVLTHAIMLLRRSIVLCRYWQGQVDGGENIWRSPDSRELEIHAFRQHPITKGKRILIIPSPSSPKNTETAVSYHLLAAPVY